MTVIVSMAVTVIVGVASVPASCTGQIDVINLTFEILFGLSDVRV